jgi:hypothetical protein
MFSLCIWLISCRVMPLRFMQVKACVRTAFLFMAKWYSVISIYHILSVFIYWWILGLFPFFRYCESKCYNDYWLYIYLYDIFLSFLAFCSALVGGGELLDHMVILFVLLRSWKTIFYSGCIHFTFPPATDSRSPFPTPLSICYYSLISFIRPS